MAVEKSVTAEHFTDVEIHACILRRYGTTASDSGHAQGRGTEQQLAAPPRL
jgi:hypothetical protein